MSQENTSPNAFVVLTDLLGRQPMSPTELLKELHRADWPDLCYLHSADFLALSSVMAVARDDEGLYFQLANTQVRPQGSEKILNLSDYQGPDRIVPAAWSER